MNSTLLAGWTVAVKENIDIAGLVAAAGSPALVDAPPAAADAEIIRRVRALGVTEFVPVGMHEFAFGSTGVNPHFGTPDNPGDPGRIPGGSSSGSAVAVASGAARLAVGTDTGGSVRIPAALCGVVGLKFAHDPALLDGVFPVSGTLDHIGLFARDLDDMDIAAGALLPEDGRPAVTSFAVRLDPAADPVIRAGLDGLVDRLRVGGLVWDGSPGLPELDETWRMTTTVMFYEAARAHRRLLPPDTPYGPDIRARLNDGAAITDADYRAALERCAEFGRQVRAMLAGGVVLLEPTVPVRAPLLDQATDQALPRQLVRWTRLANAIGLPAVSVPLPGMPHPVGVQLTGLSVGQVLAAARVVGRHW